MLPPGSVAGLRPKAPGLLKECGRLLIQDGSSFAFNEARHEQAPG